MRKRWAIVVLLLLPVIGGAQRPLVQEFKVSQWIVNPYARRLIGLSDSQLALVKMPEELVPTEGPVWTDEMSAWHAEAYKRLVSTLTERQVDALFDIYVRMTGLRAFQDEQIRARLAMTEEQKAAIDAGMVDTASKINPPEVPHPQMMQFSTAAKVRSGIAWADYEVRKTRERMDDLMRIWECVRKTLSEDQWQKYVSIRGTLMLGEQQPLEVAMVSILLRSPTARAILGVDSTIADRLLASDTWEFHRTERTTSLDEFGMSEIQIEKLRRIALQVNRERSVYYLDVWNLLKPTAWQAITLWHTTYQSTERHNLVYWQSVARWQIPPGSSDDYVVYLQRRGVKVGPIRTTAGAIKFMSATTAAISEILTPVQRRKLQQAYGEPIPLIWKIRAEL